MTNDSGDNGFTINQLWGAALVLGLAALGSAIAVITYVSKAAPHLAGGATETADPGRLAALP